MATTVNLRKVLDRKQWEPLTPSPVASGAGIFQIDSSLTNRQMMVTGVSAIYFNDPSEDASLQLPNSGLTGTFGAGSCGCHHPAGPSGTATAGSSSTLTTNLTIPGSLAGYTIRITSGTGAGQDRVISSNTVGANSVLTVPTWTTTPDATSVYTIYSGRFYVWNAGTASTFGFRYYDTATNTWSAELTKASVGTTWGTDGRLIATPGALVTGAIATGTATSATPTTLTVSGKSWTTNQWANFQVRITGGTGAGQVRSITSNTGTVLTVPTWTTTPDATSTYVIEGNEDYLYLMGNAAVTLYRYSISGNNWTTLSPGTARTTAPGAGASGHWVASSADPNFNIENAIVNGRRIYSFRGGASNALDYYDIPSNAWTNGVTYQRQNETFTTGTCYAFAGDNLYIQKDATGRWFRFNFPTHTLDPWSTLVYPQGAAAVGDRAWITSYTDGGTIIRWVNFWINSSTPIFRCLII